MGFVILVDDRVKLKEGEKIQTNTWTLQENWKKLWNTKVKVIPMVVGALRMIPRSLEKGPEELEISGRNTQISHGNLETCCHWNSSEKPLANADMKNSQGER